MVDGRLLRRHPAVCSSPARSRAGRSRCPIAGAGRERHPASAAVVAIRLSALAGSRHPCLRMEGHDVARKDRRFGLLLGEGGFQQLEHRKLGRQLRIGRGDRG